MIIEYLVATLDGSAFVLLCSGIIITKLRASLSQTAERSYCDDDLTFWRLSVGIGTARIFN
jgi:hypothetical protein